MESKEYIIETTGSGVAVIDYDNDGLPDLFIVSGDGAPSRLYHNEGGTPVPRCVGADGLTRIGWGQGACAGDYDNDGYTDLFVTYWGQNILYRNEGGKRFRDVTKEAGLTAGPHPLQHRLRLSRLRPRRPPRSVRRQLPEVQLRRDAQAGRESLLLVPADARELRSARSALRSQYSVPRQRRTARSPMSRRRVGSPRRIRTTA